jgi:hypothetical protein
MRGTCVIRVIHFGSIFRVVMGFSVAIAVKADAALFVFPALFEFQADQKPPIDGCPPRTFT